MTDRILLVEDDARLAGMVKDYLGDAGFHVTIAPNGADAIELNRTEVFNALILDLMLPDMDGLEICRQIRARESTPILMLTARGDAMDRIVGLELGADDYLVKPFVWEELAARIRALVRRGGGGSGGMLRSAGIELDPARHISVVRRCGSCNASCSQKEEGYCDAELYSAEAAAPRALRHPNAGT